VREGGSKQIYAMLSDEGRGDVLVFLNANRNNLQVHGSTVVALHPDVFRVLYFPQGMKINLLSSSLLGIFNAHRKIHKRTDTDVAFTQEYSRVSIFTGNVKCTRESRPSKDKDKRRKIYIFLARKEELSRVF
jgi:hypothetical protein